MVATRPGSFAAVNGRCQSMQAMRHSVIVRCSSLAGRCSE
ncbi:hypothetical protein A2U01_0077523, partial [Trifolium medium]|nr:hypothetical protein [Trifolium medium]